METFVQIETRMPDVLLLDEEGRPLPRPMITVTTDSNTRIILDVQVSVGKPSKPNDQTNGTQG
jgi:sugar (pentulose or hexulose) kinase